MDPGKRPRRTLIPAAPAGKSQNGSHHQDNDNDLDDPEDCDDDFVGSKIDSAAVAPSAKRKVRNLMLQFIFLQASSFQRYVISLKRLHMKIGPN
jgi:hypothetical protein